MYAAKAQERVTLRALTVGTHLRACSSGR
jgi:hypothetical protein